MFLLRGWKERFGLTWITFPTYAVLGCLLAYGLTQYWIGSSLRVNQIDVVDIDVETKLLRRNTWTHLFSPRSSKYDILSKPYNLWLRSMMCRP